MCHSRIVAFLAVALLLCAARSASALSRAYQPLVVTIAQADAIVEANVTTLSASNAKMGSTTITVNRVLKGKVAEGTMDVTMSEISRYWVGIPWKEGGRFILFLQQRRGQAGFEIMDHGSRPHTDDDASEIASLIQRLPGWSKPENGLSTLLTTERVRYRVDDEIDLCVGCRNDSDTDIKIRYTDWPRETSSRWKLEVQKEGDALIAAQPHPTITPKDIEDYFSKHGRTYAVTLKPGEHHWVYLKRINTAKPGWGYKEELDFKYYPMTSPGKYTLSVIGENLLAKGWIKAGSIEVTLE
ncbi:hypothetical protein [Roseimicrobium sp. ORNL1]|uniref:hypothetical protein n=1 Tax=Roseimicrobium sp. ORNL1 TaxID=2711231 RepID=UPI0013E15824|nr:hypothetical protein [Roseimicrobium sp. ORNL1]QIF04191.1 hypothetical protein G5S37_22580 [Roseimicrobium sp. ORNL1]